VYTPQENLTRHPSSPSQARVPATPLVQRNHVWQRKTSPGEEKEGVVTISFLVLCCRAPAIHDNK